MTVPQQGFDYEAVTWGGGGVISADAPDFLDHSLHLRYALEALEDVTGTVLEIGCGSGRFIASVAAHRPDLEAWGCDLSQTALKAAEQHQKVRFLLGSAEQLPYQTGAANAVLMIDVLEHLPNLDRGLEEARRVLAPGGVFHLVFPCEGHPLTLLGRSAQLRKLKRRHAGHIQQIGPKELFRRLSAHGLTPAQHRYSYHLLGQLYDVAVFSALGLGVDMHGARQSHVESGRGGLVQGLRKGLSRLLWAESRLLAHVPLGMTVHVTCR